MGWRGFWEGAAHGGVYGYMNTGRYTPGNKLYSVVPWAEVGNVVT